MRVLGIESSCDETGAAVVAEGGLLLSNVVHSQIPIHQTFGGVVPEVASRQHLIWMPRVVQRALDEAGLTVCQLDGVAVTSGPGLAGCLLTGVAYAKAVSWASGLPIVGVNHLEGHLFAPFVGGPPPELPLLALLVSGGHTSLVVARAIGDYELLGGTRDDAAGEAFDKVGKLLGLGYPAGAAIDRLARQGDREAFAFPRAMLNRQGFEFSFSGLKTSALSRVRESGPPEGQDLADLCASFQEAIVDVLVGKTLRAIEATGIRNVVVSGGVSANSRLRERMGAAVAGVGGALHVPTLALCADNAAMIAWVGRERLLRGERASASLTANPGRRLAE